FRNNPGDSGRLILSWLIRACHAWKGPEPFFTSYFDKLAGTPVLKKQILAGMTEKEIRRSWQDDLRKFMKIRRKYLLY
ncbi:MAG TPA: DUF1343 domain-containing protein, partial [Bacteroidales bacterium]|nr:DUF1343 domain-containing protein [Bacteroidales bacterium]